mgnify:CR=1 FL=1
MVRKLAEIVIVNILTIFLYWVILCTIGMTAFGAILRKIGITMFHGEGFWILCFSIPVIFGGLAGLYVKKKDREGFENCPRFGNRKLTFHDWHGFWSRYDL